MMIKTCPFLFDVFFKVLNENTNLSWRDFKRLCKNVSLSDRQIPPSRKWFYQHDAI